MNPDEDFVQDIDPNEDEKTKVITPEEMDKIRDDAPASSELIPDDEEDEDDDKINPKMEKAITIMGIAAAVIIAIIALYLLGSFLGWFHFGSSSSSKKEETKTSTKAEETITVPDLTGMTEDEAKAALEKAGLKYELSGKESSDTVKEGLVVRQTPVAKKKVAEGTKVKVTLSSGKADQSVDVPNVVGQSESKAKSTLTGAGFKVDVSYEYSDSVASGNVISQTPSSGTANEGDTIKIVVSRGEDPNKTKMVSVPNFTKGASYDSVASALSALNLTAQRVESPNNDPAYDDGAVLSVEPVSGSQVAEGSTIKVYVNKAKEKTPPTSESTNPPVSGAGAGGSENPSDPQQDPNQPAGNQ
jgi:serine/threonine-protein kinase